MAATCTHLQELPTPWPSPDPVDGCKECLQSGDHWVHLRMCATCGHVGCCDSSPNRHARQHYGTVGHPLVRSYQPGEAWWWCYADTMGFEVEGVESARVQFGT